MDRIYVDIENKSYYIYIVDNGWQSFIHNLKDCIHSKKLLVICDENVYNLYYQDVDYMLDKHRYEYNVAVIPAGEATKSLEWAQKLYTAALDARLDRQSAIIALGGGVVGDIAGFVAATFMRGINFVQVPTTLLAQIDSSVGGKVAINHFQAKNMIGAFHQPAMVYINIDTLTTLSRREFASGLAELIKYGYIWDYKFFTWIEANIEKILDQEVKTLQYAIYRACEIKSHIVSLDETEQGMRTILNFGHTVGHAIEAATKYQKYTHGEAIAIGMVYESAFAHALGLVDREYVDKLTKLLDKCSLPTQIPEINSSIIINKMKFDKKNRQGNIVFVLPTGVGKVDIFSNIDEGLLHKVLLGSRGHI